MKEDDEQNKREGSAIIIVFLGTLALIAFLLLNSYTHGIMFAKTTEIPHIDARTEAAIDSLPFDVGDYVISTQEFNETFNTSVYGKIKRISIFGENIVIIENETSGGICQEYTYAVENNIVYSTSYNTPTWCREIHSDKRFFEMLK